MGVDGELSEDHHGKRGAVSPLPHGKAEREASGRGSRGEPRERGLKEARDVQNESHTKGQMTRKKREEDGSTARDAGSDGSPPAKSQQSRTRLRRGAGRTRAPPRSPRHRGSEHLRQSGQSAHLTHRDCAAAGLFALFLWRGRIVRTVLAAAARAPCPLRGHRRLCAAHRCRTSERERLHGDAIPACRGRPARPGLLAWLTRAPSPRKGPRNTSTALRGLPVGHFTR